MKPQITSQYNPLQVNGTILKPNQVRQVHETVHEILNNLDTAAMKELTSGYQRDVDQLIDILIQETASVLTGDNPVTIGKHCKIK